jgi:hypothetical protein
MAHCPIPMDVQVTCGAAQVRVCRVSPALTCDSVGVVGDQKGAQMHQDKLVALLDVPMRRAYPLHVGDACSLSGGVCMGVHVDVDVDVGACDCADVNGCVRDYDCENVSSQPSLQVVAVVVVALASLQGESGDGCESVVGAGEGEDECGGKNYWACVHITAQHVGDAPWDR